MHVLVVIALIAGGAVVGYLFGRNRSNEQAFWQGRMGGWKACERMIFDRAKDHPNYDADKVFEDLIQ